MGSLNSTRFTVSTRSLLKSSPRTCGENFRLAGFDRCLNGPVFASKKLLADWERALRRESPTKIEPLE